MNSSRFGHGFGSSGCLPLVTRRPPGAELGPGSGSPRRRLTGGGAGSGLEGALYGAKRLAEGAPRAALDEFRAGVGALNVPVVRDPATGALEIDWANPVPGHVAGGGLPAGTQSPHEFLTCFGGQPVAGHTPWRSEQTGVAVPQPTTWCGFPAGHASFRPTGDITGTPTLVQNHFNGRWGGEERRTYASLGITSGAAPWALYFVMDAASFKIYRVDTSPPQLVSTFNNRMPSTPIVRFESGPYACTRVLFAVP
eukprot:tig00000681_g3092.t1